MTAVEGITRNSGKDDNPLVVEEERVRLVWHRRDLRLHDNELYADDHDYTQDSNCFYSDPSQPCHATRKIKNSSLKIISLFVFDNHYFQPQPSSMERSHFHTIWYGPHYTNALIDAVYSLRNSIRLIGGELLVRMGDPVLIVPQIAQQIGATEVWYHEEPGTYECQIAKTIQRVCTLQYGINVCSKVGYTLYHPNDLPLNHNEWSHLAHPKQYKQKKKKPTKENQLKSQTYHSCLLDSIVDVSSDRFTGMCRIMGDFRRAVSSHASVRPVIQPPEKLVKPKGYDLLNIDPGRIPTLEDLFHSIMGQNLANSNISIMGMDDETIQIVLKSAIEQRNARNKTMVSGGHFGESAALQRLETFVGQGYAKVANRSLADVSNHNSSRFSTYFALGSLSPRTVYWRAHTAGEGCEWLKSHLEMRDFFLFTCFATGSKMFQEKGIPLNSHSSSRGSRSNGNKKKESIQWNCPTDDAVHLQTWKQWATGNTKLPMIDAGMKELLSTGYCSNRIRQNMASVLTKDLRIDWRAGAEWFQFLLEDHCVGSNYGNWLYFSGVGPDPKNRHFRTVSQMKRYDPKGMYVKKWIPELKNLDSIEAVFRPWDFGIVSFESPIVDPSSQYTWQDWQNVQQMGRLWAYSVRMTTTNDHKM
jgi:deoxyribodipyrimidine photo-lyase